jgi:hypothetical protein
MLSWLFDFRCHLVIRSKAFSHRKMLVLNKDKMIRPVLDDAPCSPPIFSLFFPYPNAAHREVSQSYLKVAS